MVQYEKVNKREQNLYEHLIYVVLWGLVLLFPLARIGGSVFDQGTLDWEYIFQNWLNVAPFLLLMLIHSALLVPYLLFRRATNSYIASSLLLLTLFFFFILGRYQRAVEQQPKAEQIEQIIRNAPPGRPLLDPAGPMHAAHLHPGSENRIPGPVVMDMLIAVLLLGCNLAIRLLFKSYSERNRMDEMEKAHIQHELSQLKAQISPHFLMNSLNNIHGMVELDAERAQEMILELSGMMRYVLYESSPQRIALAKEISFLQNYISLMQVRYSKKRVSIRFRTPEKELTKNITIPPLILIIFIENAFKHGISYQNDSFIEIEIKVSDSKLYFLCTNSCQAENKPSGSGGIGLKNIRKRLQILFGENHNLTIEHKEHIFHVSLILPTQNEDSVYSNR